MSLTEPPQDAPAKENAKKRVTRGGGKGFAARELGATVADRDFVRAAERSALKKVGAKASSEPKKAARAQPDPARRATSARQAALGMMGRRPQDFDEDSLDSWVAGLDDEARARLAKLLRVSRESGRREDSFDRVEKRFGQGGNQFSITADNVTINVAGGSGYGGGGYGAGKGKNDYYNKSRAPNWGRQLGRIKDFINGR